VYFVTQNPADLPEEVLAQLGNRVQHALRAYTPKEQKAVRVAAESFRPNPEFDTADTITRLGVGEALVSTLQAKGVPSMVGRTMMRPPSSRLGPIMPEERQAIIAQSPVLGLYDEVIDRDSAAEMLERKAAQRQTDIERATRIEETRVATRRTSNGRQTVTEAAIKSFARTVARQLGNQLVRGVLGGLTRSR
jgi:DNA helicase HerA-like ATPase